MSYSCPTHGWRSVREPCPNCGVGTVTTTSLASATERMACSHPVSEKIFTCPSHVVPTIHTETDAHLHCRGLWVESCRTCAEIKEKVQAAVKARDAEWLSSLTNKGQPGTAMTNLFNAAIALQVQAARVSAAGAQREQDAQLLPCIGCDTHDKWTPVTEGRHWTTGHVNEAHRGYIVCPRVLIRANALATDDGAYLTNALRIEYERGLADGRKEGKS